MQSNFASEGASVEAALGVVDAALTMAALTTSPMLFMLLALAALLQPADAAGPDFLAGASMTGFVISIIMMVFMCSCCFYVCFLECGRKKTKPTADA